MDKVRTFVLSVVIVVSCLFSSCGCGNMSLSGMWKVDRVDIDFDESRVTPEMVRQLGAMEKRGYMIFDADSSLRVYDGENVMDTRYSYRADGSLYYESVDSVGYMIYLGQYDIDKIVVQKQGVLGKTRLTYIKQ